MTLAHKGVPSLVRFGVASVGGCWGGGEIRGRDDDHVGLYLGALLRDARYKQGLLDS